MLSQTYHPLNNGARIPAIGFGCAADGSEQYDKILHALKVGYRSIDTAEIYKTEESVGRAVRDSGIPREDIFITTKLWNHHHHPDDVEAACDASLKRLGLSYVDLYLIHWPVAFKRGDAHEPKHPDGPIELENIDCIDTWKAMEKLVHKGKARAIGISNFTPTDIERILTECSISPADHQIESHPYLQQPKFAEYHKEKGIHITQFSPMGPNPQRKSSLPSPLDDPTVLQVADKYGKTPAQVVLAWGIAHGRSVIPKASSAKRIEENLGSDFKMDPEDLAKIDVLDKKIRMNNPAAEWNVEGALFQGLLDE